MTFTLSDRWQEVPDDIVLPNGVHVRMNLKTGRKEAKWLNGGDQEKAKTNGSAQPRKLDFIWADDIEPEIDAPGLVDGLLGTTAMTVVYGESGAGKSFVAIDLACHVAGGMPWRDMDVERGVVVYIAAEGPKSVQRRVWAWMQHHNVHHLPLVVIKSPVDLLRGDADVINAMLAEIRKQCGRIALVVVDTLNRAMVGNENAPEDMGAFVTACASIRDATETHVLVVHHCGKETAKGARGHSSLRAATDVELEITKLDAGGCIRVSKNRDEEEGTNYGFRLEQFELGTNRKGRRVTTCIALEADAPAGGGKKRALGPNERIVLDSLASAIADGPDIPPLAGDIPPHAKGVTLERWQDAAMRYLPQDKSNKKREAFNRAKLALVANNLALHVDGFAWLP
jgi:AAA domain